MTAREREAAGLQIESAATRPPTAASSQAVAALLLALAAGCVDAVSFLVLHQTFTANMTGNSTELGIAGGFAHGSAAVPLVVAVAVFVIAIALGTALIELATRRGLRATAAPALLLEGALILAFIGVGGSVVHHGTTSGHRVTGFYVLLTVAVLAMGIQTASLTRALGRTVRTTFVSGLLAMAAQELVNAVAPPPRHRSSYLQDELGLGTSADSRARLAFHACVWLAFIGGAAWGAFSQPRWSTAGLGPAVGAVLVTAAIDLLRPIHSAPAGRGR
jgi:uncharacterized membrane protein YoaK (UPF0700 family)